MNNRILLGLVFCLISLSRVSGSFIFALNTDNHTSETFEKLEEDLVQDETELFKDLDDEVSLTRDKCPSLATSCPKCLAQYDQLPYDICSYPVVLKVLLLSKPNVDGPGRLCGRFGVLSAHGKTDIREFRRLLTFSIGQNCGCNLKPTSRYFLLSEYRGLYKEGALYSEISLSADVVLIPTDRYTEGEVEKRLQECNPPVRSESTPTSNLRGRIFKFGLKMIRMFYSEILKRL